MSGRQREPGQTVTRKKCFGCGKFRILYLILYKEQRSWYCAKCVDAEMYIQQLGKPTDMRSCKKCEHAYYGSNDLCFVCAMEERAAAAI